jgi:hypothetical protein
MGRGGGEIITPERLLYGPGIRLVRPTSDQVDLAWGDNEYLMTLFQQRSKVLIANGQTNAAWIDDGGQNVHRAVPDSDGLLVEEKPKELPFERSPDTDPRMLVEPDGSLSVLWQSAKGHLHTSSFFDRETRTTPPLNSTPGMDHALCLVNGQLRAYVFDRVEDEHVFLRFDGSGLLPQRTEIFSTDFNHHPVLALAEGDTNGAFAVVAGLRTDPKLYLSLDGETVEEYDSRAVASDLRFAIDSQGDPAVLYVAENNEIVFDRPGQEGKQAFIGFGAARPALALEDDRALVAWGSNNGKLRVTVIDKASDPHERGQDLEIITGEEDRLVGSPELFPRPDGKHELVWVAKRGNRKYLYSQVIGQHGPEDLEQHDSHAAGNGPLEILGWDSQNSHLIWRRGSSLSRRSLSPRQ